MGYTLLMYAFAFFLSWRVVILQVNVNEGCLHQWTHFLDLHFSLAFRPGTLILHSSIPKSLNLNLDSPTQNCHPTKLGFQLQDQESSSTQSSGQSHREMASMGLRNSSGHYISGQYGHEETLGRHVDGHVKSVLSLGSPDYFFPKVDYSQSVAHIACPHTDPYFGGVLASYGPQAFMQPQMLGMLPTRIPLPPDLAEDEPIYVNAKQYRGILRRRQSRAKLEAQKKLVRARKPYLHESRHLHAMKRARGSGGRFLNTKKLQQSGHSLTTTGDNTSGSAPLHLGGSLSESEVVQSENGNGSASATCSDVTSVSNSDDIFRKADLGFSSFHSQMVGSLQGGGIMHNGPQHRVSVIH